MRLQSIIGKTDVGLHVFVNRIDRGFAVRVTDEDGDVIHHVELFPATANFIVNALTKMLQQDYDYDGGE